MNRTVESKNKALVLEAFDTLFNKRDCAAAEKFWSPRYILESAAFLFKDALMPPAYLLGKLLFPTVVADATDMETIIRGSELDWTLLRPPRLTDNEYTGRYRVREGNLPRFGFSISRANVADCFLRLLEDTSTARKIFGVSS